MRPGRLVPLVVAILLMGFSCFNVKYLTIQVPVRTGLAIETLWEEYGRVAKIVRGWAAESGVTETDCAHTARSGSPACRGFEFGLTRISVLFEPAERRTTVEIFEGSARQSPRSKQAQKELRRRLVATFGEARVRDARW